MLLAAKLFSMPPAEQTKHSHQEMPSRPGSAASVASSTSSFRIPGIQALAPPASRQSTPSDPSFVLPASYVRLFTPDTDVQATSQSRTLHLPSRHECRLAQHAQRPTAQRVSRKITNSSRTSTAPPSQSALHGQGHFAASESLRHSGPTDEPLRPFTASSYHRSRLVTPRRNLLQLHLCRSRKSRNRPRSWHCFVGERHRYAS